MNNENAAGGDTEENRVARFLAENPDWLATQPELYGMLSPPRRVHGDTLADHMAAMIDAARQRAASMTAQAETVLQAGRAALSLADRVREAVLALIRATDLGECIAGDLPRLLGIDSALLWVEGPVQGLSERLMARSLPPGTVVRLLGRRNVRARIAPPDAGSLHGEAAPLAAHDALLRVTVRNQPPMLLALGSRDAPVLQDGLPASVADMTAGGGSSGSSGSSGGTTALAFLAAALAARIESLA